MSGKDTGGLPMLGRRQFLVGAGAAGLLVGFAIAPRARAQVPEPDAGSARMNAWVLVAPDGTVTLQCGRSEMGQGVFTGLATLVAEELGCAWSSLRVETGPPDAAFKNVAGGKNLLAPSHLTPEPGGGFADWLLTGIATLATEQFTGGSKSIPDAFVRAREAGAVAREMLVTAAARNWGVAPAECTVAEGTVVHAASGRSAGFGELAAAAARVEPPSEVTLKPRGEWKLIGTSPARLDLPAKVDGSARFASDVRRPGMLFAAVANCPVPGGALKSFDAAPVRAMPGVKAVRAVPGGVAVVADNGWRARQGLAALAVQWDDGPNAALDTALVEATLAKALDGELDTAFEAGDGASALAGAARPLSAEYRLPYLAHATMEPMTCTAKVDGDKVEIWVPTQNGEASLAAAAEAAGVPPSNVKVNRPHLGGGFGRRGAFQDYVTQSVKIAKQVPGRPVKLIWSREEDMQHGFYRPITQARMVGGLDDKGNVVALHARLSGQSILASVMPARMVNGVDKLHFQGWLEDEFGYMAIPNLLIDHAMRNTHVPVGFWRGVNHNQNAIYMECFIDELAHAAGKDPLEFRRALMAKNPKHLAVLNAAAEKAEWGKPLPKGVHRGICQNMGFGSYSAAVAEVSVSPEGKVKIHRIVAATDPGYAVNPDQIAAQVEGSFVYGLSTLLYSENTVKDGRIVETNFHDYQVMRIDDMPKVETVLVPSGGFWGGIGEPTIAVAAPAVLNAIFAATGKRIRTLPLKHHDLRSA